MKRIFIITAGLLTAVLFLSACTKSGVNNSLSSGDSQIDGSNTPRNNEGRRPDFGQPDRQADIRGIIKSVIGNEVVVLKLDMGVGRMASSTEADNQEAADLENKAPAISLSGGNMPGGGTGRAGGFAGPGGGPGMPGEQSTTDRASMLARLKEMSTGEETVLMPVGIKMLKPSASSTGKQREMVEASLSDITSDKSVTIWLNSNVTDRKVAEFVLIN